MDVREKIEWMLGKGWNGYWARHKTKAPTSMTMLVGAKK